MRIYNLNQKVKDLGSGFGYTQNRHFKPANSRQGCIYNKRYKVMSVKDYSLNGFIEYQLVRDFEENPVNE